jgi:hypothetical protein
VPVVAFSSRGRRLRAPGTAGFEGVGSGGGAGSGEQNLELDCSAPRFSRFCSLGEQNLD